MGAHPSAEINRSHHLALLKVNHAYQLPVGAGLADASASVNRHKRAPAVRRDSHLMAGLSVLGYRRNLKSHPDIHNREGVIALVGDQQEALGLSRCAGISRVGRPRQPAREGDGKDEAGFWEVSHGSLKPNSIWKWARESQMPVKSALTELPKLPCGIELAHKCPQERSDTHFRHQIARSTAGDGTPRPPLWLFLVHADAKTFHRQADAGNQREYACNPSRDKQSEQEVQAEYDEKYCQENFCHKQRGWGNISERQRQQRLRRSAMGSLTQRGKPPEPVAPSCRKYSPN